MHIVNFNDTEKLQIACFEVLVQRIARAYFKQTVKIALIDEAESPVCNPFKPSSYDYD